MGRDDNDVDGGFAEDEETFDARGVVDANTYRTVENKPIADLRGFGELDGPVGEDPTNLTSLGAVRPDFLEREAPEVAKEVLALATTVGASGSESRALQHAVATFHDAHAKAKTATRIANARGASARNQVQQSPPIPDLDVLTAQILEDPEGGATTVIQWFERYAAWRKRAQAQT